MKTITLLLLALTLIVSTSIDADTILFSDNFNSADSSDLNADLSRQTGSLGSLNWNKTGGNATNSNASKIESNQLVLLGAGTAPHTFDFSAELDYNLGSNPALLDNGAFKISYDLLNLGGSYASFALTSAANRSRPAVESLTVFGLLFSGSKIGVRGAGGGETAAVNPYTWDLPSTLEFTVTTDSITNGTAFTIDMTVDASTIDLNGAAAGTAFSGTWGSNNLYLALSTRVGDSIVDNFAISVIPEVNTIGLVLLGFISLIVLRPRKSK